jgi:uncharacterized protein
MSKPGPDRVDAQWLAAEGRHLTREFPLARFARLADSILTQDGVVRLNARFCKVDDRPAVDLEVAAVLVVRCQRCLGALEVPVSSHVGLVFDTAAGAAEELPAGDYEPVPLDAAAVDLAGLVEDELLLSVPLVPLHEHCGETAVPGMVESEAARPAGTQRPFVDLKNLLKR